MTGIETTATAPPSPATLAGAATPVLELHQVGKLYPGRAAGRVAPRRRP